MRRPAGVQYVVDIGHIVAFNESIQYTARRAGGLKSTLFSGEGLVAEFTGPGHLWMQTRNPEAFVHWISSRLPSGRRQGVVETVGGDTSGAAVAGGTTAVASSIGETSSDSSSDSADSSSSDSD